MQLAARSSVGAGIALVGAAVIAVQPVAPMLPDISVPGIHAAQVELAALANPADQWAQVVGAAIDNLGQLGQQVLADPAPVIQKIINNQLANSAVLGKAIDQASTAISTAVQGLPAVLQTASEQLAAGNVSGAVQTIIGPVLPLALGIIDGVLTGYSVVTNTAQNLANVVAAVPNLILPTLLAVTGPVISGINAVSDTAQNVVNGVTGGNVEAVVNALVGAPAQLTGAILNGFGNGPLGLPSPGLLSPLGDLGGLTAGTIAGLLSLRDTIAAALKPLANPTAQALDKTATTGTAVVDTTVSRPTVTLAVPSAPTAQLATAPETSSTTTDADSAPTPSAGKHRAGAGAGGTTVTKIRESISTSLGGTAKADKAGTSDTSDKSGTADKASSSGKASSSDKSGAKASHGTSAKGGSK
jgi:hypothetical protein